VGAPGGLCPQCLLRLGLGADLSTGGGHARPDLTATTAEATPGPSANSALDRLAETVGSVPRVLLREAPQDGDTPVVRPSSPEVRAADGAGRYQLLGELGRGGMGVVLKGRDPDLGRDLAVKILLEAHRGQPELVRRFVEEAQIGGQLQHPGVVPVYELGTLPDRRPYFTMRLVKGRTLAALLNERPDPSNDLPRFLAVFEAVCQTVAYAHARGVIHRDLKPSNVMVGSFGEVQVMDWGLAKVLEAGGVADERPEAPADVSVIRTVRSGSDADASRAGSVLGTPAYMAPEQARGEVEAVDERADVFALGAILCEILTGKPPFLGRNPGEIQRKSARGDLADAVVRLESCGADAELVELAKDCLAPEANDRPGDAQAVAERTLAYLNGVYRRIRDAELAQAAEAARAEEARRTAEIEAARAGEARRAAGEAEERARAERRARRSQVGLAASLLAMTIAGGLGAMYFLQQRSARAAAVERLLGEVTTLRGVASKEPEEVARWEAVLTALRQADVAVASGGDPEARRRLAALRQETQVGADSARRDRALLDIVADIRSRKDDFGFSGIDDAYDRAFRDAGLNVDGAPPAESGARLKARPASVAVAAAAALDDWALVRRSDRQKDVRWRRPLEAARVADPDPFRDKVRAALLDRDEAARAAELRRLASSPEAAALPPASAVLLAASLMDAEAAVALLRAAVGRSPDDAWVNHKLAERLGELRPAPREEMVRYYSAARAVRPVLAHELACLLDDMGRTDEALAVFADIAARRAAYPFHLAWYGERLKLHGRPEAAGVLERAVAAGREAVRLHPDDASAHNSLGMALGIQGKPEQLEEAVAEFRAAIRLEPDYPGAHGNLGLALQLQGKLEEAIAEYREAIQLRPNDASFHHNLGILLRPGKLDEAVAEYREAIRLKPDDGSFHLGLGGALHQQGKLEEALAEYRDAVRLKPSDAGVHFSLGVVLQTQGDFAGSLAEFRTWRELQSKLPGWRPSSGRFIEDVERKAVLAERLPALLRGDDRPRDNAERLIFAQICHARKRHAAAARFWAKALADDPKLGDDRWNAHRYSAARDAILAADGKDEGGPLPDDAAKVKLRSQALDWLKAEREALAKVVDGGDTKAGATITRTLQHWKTDPDLAAIRDPDALAKLPEAERKEWEALWANVDALLKRAQGKTP
jgi:serine/threonine-protein kinase